MPKAWYALRRTLPVWSWEENLKELVGYCSRNSVDEVILKVDTEEFSHGIPSVEWLDNYLPILHKTKEELSAIGVETSINPWVTLVHCDRGRHIKDIYPDIDLMVGHDGTQCTACSCPLSPGWKSATKALWQRYASVKPSVIWVEDDIRLLNHQPVVYGCFCSIHMREFSERVGKEVSREELVKALLAPGNPQPYRKVWLDLNRDKTVETVAFLEKCVHEVSPETKMGLMCSGPNAHSIEGRDWDAYTSALAGDQPLVARPCMCNYSEFSPRGLYDSEYFLRSTLYCLKPETIIQTEVENWPFTGYSKSAKFTYLQCALSFIFGADGVTLNLYDHIGTPMDVTPEFGDMLREKKAYLSALSDMCYKGKPQGIRILHAKNGAYYVHVPEGAPWNALHPEGQAWRSIVEPLGFPVTFGDSPVTAISGQVIRAFSKDEIKKILCLVEMGYGDLLGINIKRVFRKYDEPLAAEELIDSEFGGAEKKYLTMTLPHLGGDAVMAEIEPAEGARVISRVVDPDCNPVYPFVTLYENKLGGRVAFYPLDIEYIATGPAFLHPYRKEQLHYVLNWISRGNTPLEFDGGPYPLSFRIDQDDSIIIGAFNLTLDDWPGASFTLSSLDKELAGKIEMLDSDGVWKSDPSASIVKTGSSVRVELTRAVDALSLVVLSIK
jgi:hypothetical protein